MIVRERRFELRDDLRVALRLFHRRERMHAREVLPRHRQHLGRGVQLHRARPERDHRVIEADVLALEQADVAHHRRFRAMRVEDGMGQERRLRTLEWRRHIRAVDAAEHLAASCRIAAVDRRRRHRHADVASANTSTMSRTSAGDTVSLSAISIVSLVDVAEVDAARKRTAPHRFERPRARRTRSVSK